MSTFFDETPESELFGFGLYFCFFSRVFCRFQTFLAINSMSQRLGQHLGIVQRLDFNLYLGQKDTRYLIADTVELSLAFS